MWTSSRISNSVIKWHHSRALFKTCSVVLLNHFTFFFLIRSICKWRFKDDSSEYFTEICVIIGSKRSKTKIAKSKICISDCSIRPWTSEEFLTNKNDFENLGATFIVFPAKPLLPFSTESNLMLINRLFAHSMRIEIESNLEINEIRKFVALTKKKNS